MMTQLVEQSGGALWMQALSKERQGALLAARFESTSISERIPTSWSVYWGRWCAIFRAEVKVTNKVVACEVRQPFCFRDVLKSNVDTRGILALARGKPHILEQQHKQKASDSAGAWISICI